MDSSISQAAQSTHAAMERQNVPYSQEPSQKYIRYLPCITVIQFHNSYSPAQLLMGHRIRTMVPILPMLLDPLLPDSAILHLWEKEKMVTDQKYLNKHHHVHELWKFSPGKQRLVMDQKVSGIVVEEHSTPCSYVDVLCGTVHRNRHLIPMDEAENSGDTHGEPHLHVRTHTSLTPQTPCVGTQEKVFRRHSRMWFSFVVNPL